MANNRELSQFANTVGYNGGNIGIGTDNPDATLKVNVASGNNGVVVQNTSTANIALIGARNGDATLQIGQFGSTASGTTFGLSNANLAFIYTTTYNTTHPSALTLGTVSNKPIVFATNNTERLRITSAGNVSIGSLTDDSIGSTTTLTIDRSSGNGQISFAANGTVRGRIFADNSTSDFRIGNPTSNDLMLYTNNLERLRISSAGLVGINSTSPATALDIQSTKNTDGLTVTKAGTRSVFLGHNGSGNEGILVLKENGTTKVQIYAETNQDSYINSGDFGIGTNSPSYKLDVRPTAEDPTTGSPAAGSFVQVRADDATVGKGPSLALMNLSGSKETGWRLSALTASGNNGDFTIHGYGGGAAYTERLRITAAGKLQIPGTRGGTLQPNDDDTLELYTKATSGNANTGGGITFYNNHGNGHVMGGVIHVVKQNGTYENSQSDMLFGTRINGSDVAYRARLTSHGSWETLSSTVNIDIANSQSSGNNEAYIYARYGSTGLTAGTLSFRVYTNGNVQNTNNSYSSISDQNLKENIIDATSQWDDIKALQVRKYNFREATGHQTHTQLGLIAQEVESVSPGLVETTAVREGETVLDADGNQLESIKSINYSVLYMKAVKALQEAQTRIETLETQHADLLARVTALEG